MLKLIKLEYKKNNIKKYIRNAIILAVLLCLFSFAQAFLGIANDPDGTLDAAPGRDTISSTIELFTNIVYIVFTGVMSSSFIINAYKNKTMYLMFSYPIKRRKILASQMIAVWFFNFTALVITKLAAYTCIYIGSKFCQSSFIIDFSLYNPAFYVQLILKSIVTISISFLALFAGMALQSSKAAIISSFLIILLTEANIGDLTLADNAVFSIILIIISLIATLLSIKDIETKDLL